MYFKSKKISSFILGITSIICSRALFAFFDDPEGPNLLVVIVVAAIVYFVSWAIYAFGLSTRLFSGLKRLLLAILVQVALVGCLYLLLS